MGRIVGIDFGLARIGVSLSDRSKMIALTLGRIESKKQLSETLASLRLLLEPYKEEIELIIIGNPLHLSGKVSPMSEAVIEFKGHVEAAFPYKVLLWDERLSTAEAGKALGHLDRKKRAKIVDCVAAAIILQSYLDTKTSNVV